MLDLFVSQPRIAVGAFVGTVGGLLLAVAFNHFYPASSFFVGAVIVASSLFLGVVVAAITRGR